MSATGATAPSALERALGRDRMLVALALTALALVCWLYIAIGAGTGMSATAMSGWWLAGGPAAPYTPWTLATAATMLSMWQIMMVAMMLPSAAPTMLLYARVARHAGGAVVERGVARFVGGYLVAWLGFSALATTAQFALERSGLVSSMMATSGRLLTAGLLVAAGLYQLSPLKSACLSSCRAPAQFLTDHWREGPWRMGLRHGVICVGCCWGLMLLLFVGGAMNLIWIAALAALVAAEKLAPYGAPISRLIGVLLIGGGAALALSAA